MTTFSYIKNTQYIYTYQSIILIYINKILNWNTRFCSIKQPYLYGGRPLLFVSSRSRCPDACSSFTRMCSVEFGQSNGVFTHGKTFHICRRWRLLNRLVNTSAPTNVIVMTSIVVINVKYVFSFGQCLCRRINMLLWSDRLSLKTDSQMSRCVCRTYAFEGYCAKVLNISCFCLERRAVSIYGVFSG